MRKCPCCGGDVSKRDRPYISLDTNKMMAGAEIIKLAPTEAEIIHCLAAAMPLPIPHETMFEKLWGANPVNAPLVNLHVHVSKINKKIKATGMAIKSVWGTGYRLEYTEAA